MDESKKLDRLIYHAKRMLDVSRGKLFSAIESADISEIPLAENRHVNNIKRLNKLLNKRNPIGVYSRADTSGMSMSWRTWASQGCYTDNL